MTAIIEDRETITDTERMAEVVGQSGREYPEIERAGSIVLVNDKGEDAVQYVVICDVSNQEKQAALQILGLTIASEKYAGSIE
jgi:hypothetical protein